MENGTEKTLPLGIGAILGGHPRRQATSMGMPSAGKAVFILQLGQESAYPITTQLKPGYRVRLRNFVLLSTLIARTTGGLA